MATASSIIESIFSLSNTVISGFLLRFIVAAIIILIGFVIGRMAGKVVQRVLHELELNKLIRMATSLRFTAEEFVGSSVSYIIYFFVIIMALNQLGLTTPILYILSSAVIVIIIVSFLLGLRDFIPNMFAGLSLQKKGFLKVGDNIRFRDMDGKIEYLNLVETRIMTKAGDVIAIPNSLLAKHEIVRKRRPKTKKKR